MFGREFPETYRNPDYSKEIFGKPREEEEKGYKGTILEIQFEHSGCINIVADDAALRSLKAQGVIFASDRKEREGYKSNKNYGDGHIDYADFKESGITNFDKRHQQLADICVKAGIMKKDSTLYKNLVNHISTPHTFAHATQRPKSPTMIRG